MSLLFPNLCSILRAKTNAVVAGAPQIGAVGYSGHVATTDPANPEGETLLASDLPCNIAAGSSGSVTSAGLLPDDAAGPSKWVISFGAASLAKGQLRDRDIIVDELGYRYQVYADNWTPLGYQAHATRLEA